MLAPLYSPSYDCGPWDAQALWAMSLALVCLLTLEWVTEMQNTAWHLREDIVFLGGVYFFLRQDPTLLAQYMVSLVVMIKYHSQKQLKVEGVCFCSQVKRSHGEEHVEMNREDTAARELEPS